MWLLWEHQASYHWHPVRSERVGMSAVRTIRTADTPPGVAERHVLLVPSSTPEPLLRLRILGEYSERSGTLR